MKKIISLIISLAIAMPSAFTAVYGADLQNTDKKFVVFTDEYMSITSKNANIETLAALGIIDSSVSPNAPLSRGEAALLFARMSGRQKEEGIATSYKDVPDGHIYKDAISVCETYGIIKKSGSYFRPNSTITVDETVRIFMDLLGYGKAAEVSDSDYKTFPVYSRLVSGIKTSQKEVTFAIFAGIACRAFDEMSVDATYRTNQDGANYYVGTESFLESYLGVVKISGRINAVGGSAFSGYSCKDGGAVIGNVRINNAQTLDKMSLGRTVDAYITRDRNGVVSLVGVSYKESSSKMARLHYTELFTKSAKYTKQNIVAETGDKLVDYKLKQNVSVIYNGDLFAEFDLAAISPKMGEMLLIDEDSNGVYDVVLVWSFETKLVKYISYYDSAVYMYDETHFTPNEDETEYTCYKNGLKCELTDYKPGDCLAVAKSKNTENKQCLVFGIDEKVSGKITQIKDEYVRIDNSYYRVSPYSEKMALGIEGSFFVDIYGGVSYIPGTRNDGTIYGYLLGKAQGEIFEKDKIKLFGEDGTMKILELADKISLNGNQVTSDSFAASVTLKQLLKYKTDKDGRVRQIWTANADNANKAPGFTKDKFTLDWSGEERYTGSPHNDIGGYNIGSYKTVVMFIPTYADATDEDYRLVDLSYIVDGWAYATEIYNSDEFFEPEIALIKMGYKYGRDLDAMDKDSALVVSEVTMENYKDELHYKIAVYAKENLEYLYVPADVKFSWNEVFGFVYKDEYGQCSYACSNANDEFVPTDLNAGDIIHVTDYSSIVSKLRISYRNDLENPVTNKKYMEFLYRSDGLDYSKHSMWSYPFISCVGEIYYVDDARVTFKVGENRYRTLGHKLGQPLQYTGVVYNEHQDKVRLAKKSDWQVGKKVVFYTCYNTLDAIIMFD